MEPINVGPVGTSVSLSMPKAIGPMMLLLLAGGIYALYWLTKDGK